MNNLPLVYVASKTHHAEMWKKFRSEWAAHFTVHSRWIDLIGKVNDDPANAKWFWQDDLQDITEADILIVYAEPVDKLCGTLIEAGAMLMANGQVIVIGEHPDYGTWQWHPLVHHTATLTDAAEYIADNFHETWID